MLRETFTPPAGNGAAVIAFPEPEEDIIETVTGLPLVDCDPKVIARRLRTMPWKKRAQFFNNIICESLSNTGKMIGVAKTKEDGGRFLDWGMCEMMRRIGEVLDLWGKTKPTDKNAAVPFFLSLKPAHHRAAAMYISTRAPERQATVHEQWEFVDGYMQESWPPRGLLSHDDCRTSGCGGGMAGRAAGVSGGLF